MPAYYNEFDAGAAAWLRELIKRGLIADGEVDERSIIDVSANDLRGFTQCHFFAGIGGWSYALRLAGWPDDKPVWTGSPPCQPFSSAGQQKGKDDERHLAPHFANLVAAGRPPVLFGEQVASAEVFGKSASGTRKSADGPPQWAWLDDLFERLEAAHYACGASDIPAAGVGAAHIRQRTFFGACRLAGPASARLEGAAGTLLQGRGGRHASSSSSSNDGLADASSVRPGVGARRGSNVATARNIEDGTEQRQRFRYELSAISGGFCWMADAECFGRQWRQGAESGRQYDGSDAGWQQDHDGPVGGNEAVDGSQRPSASHGGWADADWLFCRDGKWRPVEPGTFPLAHGVPARVGRLRGYGNAIVPQAAATFIKAFVSALTD